MTVDSTCAPATRVRRMSTRWIGPKSLSTSTVNLFASHDVLELTAIFHRFSIADKEDESFLLVSTPYNDGPRDVDAGKTMTFVVYVDARPDPVVDWFKDGQLEPIATSAKYVVHRSWGKTYLKIRDTSIADNGVYRLLATSGQLRKSVNFTLVVDDGL